jgi:hypothetical protein
VSDETLGAGAPDDEAILKPLREKYDGRIAPFRLGKHGLFVFRYANGQELRFHAKRIREANKQENPEAVHELTEAESVDFLRRQLEYPADKTKFAVAIEDFWRAGPTILLAINRISGASVEELGKG